MCVWGGSGGGGWCVNIGSGQSIFFHKYLAVYIYIYIYMCVALDMVISKCLACATSQLLFGQIFFHLKELCHTSVHPCVQLNLENGC